MSTHSMRGEKKVFQLVFSCVSCFSFLFFYSDFYLNKDNRKIFSFQTQENEFDETHSE